MGARRVPHPAADGRRTAAPARAVRLARRALGAVGALLLASTALAQTESQVTLTRKDTTIVVTLKAQYADGARFIGNNPNCQTGKRQALLYGPAPGYVDTRVGKDTELRSNVAIVLTPEQAAGGSNAAAGEDQTLELYDGTVTLDRPGCIGSEQRTKAPSVTMVQGRTTVRGTRFFLDQGSDTGTMDGPIELVRAAAGDSPALTASADSMRFDTQTRHATLMGNVKVTSQDRVTTADSLELDEAAGVALLAGSPARSTQGKDVLEGSRLRYYLNNNDVVVLGGVHGDLDVSIP